MKKSNLRLDVYLLGGFACSFFAGIITPYSITLILSKLTLRTITVGSLMVAGLPFVIGLVLGRGKVQKRLYKILPVVMAVETILTGAAVVCGLWNLAVYYVVSMVVFGIFTAAVNYLLQVLKQRRYMRRRAIFDRKYQMADALGYILGAGIVLMNLRFMNSIWIVLGLVFIQCILVNALFYYCYRETKG